jgi:hypothetical protein
MPHLLVSRQLHVKEIRSPTHKKGRRGIQNPTSSRCNASREGAGIRERKKQIMFEEGENV